MNINTGMNAINTQNLQTKANAAPKVENDQTTKDQFTPSHGMPTNLKDVVRQHGILPVAVVGLAMGGVACVTALAITGLAIAGAVASAAVGAAVIGATGIAAGIAWVASKISPPQAQPPADSVNQQNLVNKE